MISRKRKLERKSAQEVEIFYILIENRIINITRQINKDEVKNRDTLSMRYFGERKQKTKLKERKNEILPLCIIRKRNL